MDELLEKAINGKTLLAFDEIFREWVLEQLKKIEVGVDEDTVKTIISNVLASSESVDQITNIVNNVIESSESVDQITNIVNNVIESSDAIPTEEQITNIVNQAIEAAGSLTEERVQEMIDESVWAAITTAY